MKPPPPALPPAEAQDRRNLTILLDKVKTFWIEGVLEKSLHNIALIDLGKETQAEAVAHAWEQILELPDQSRQTLPPDKRISQIFDEMNRALLILGAPGSGKTITLLQLARDLIAQAEQDETFTQAIPVVFNLSTWQHDQPLVDWLIEELSVKYQIPKRIGRPWLENNRILPLLDGLDEVRDEDRAACVEMVNHFGEEYGLSGVAVCSRIEEYNSLPVRLKLNGAIRLQPLTLKQVYNYLGAAGEQLAELRTMLEVDEGLQSLAQSPLVLGIIVLAYQDLSAEGGIGQAHQSLEVRRRHLFDTYIDRMFRRKGQGDEHYNTEQTKKQLAWLGQHLKRNNRSIFLIEELQPSWLASRNWIWGYLFATRLIGSLIAGLMFGIIYSVRADQLFLVADALIPGRIGWLVFGFVLGLVLGLVWTFFDGIRYYHAADVVGGKERVNRWQGLLNTIGPGLVFGIVGGLVSWVFAGQWVAVWNGLFMAIVWGLFLGLSKSRQSLTNDIMTVESLSWSWQQGLRRFIVVFMGGVVAGLVFGWVFTQNQEVLNNFLSNLSWKVNVLQFILGVGLFYGLAGGMLGAMIGGLSSQIVETKTIPNQGVRLTLKNALLTGPGFGLIIMLFGGLLFGVLFGGRMGINNGLGWGLAFGTVAFAWYGGLDVINHYILRLLFWYQNNLPLKYAHFLDDAADLIFPPKSRGGGTSSSIGSCLSTLQQWTKLRKANRLLLKKARQNHI